MVAHWRPSAVQDKVEDKVSGPAQSTMMTSKPTPSPAPRRPRFLWRGLLIVLPALAMAVFGFLSLRQDRLLVRHQAAEQAEKIAEELVRAILPAGFTLNLHLPDPPAPPILSPQNDPVFGAAIHGIIAMLFDETGQLVFPQPPRWPLPEPLELDRLDPDQLELWTTARRELFRERRPGSGQVTVRSIPRAPAARTLRGAGPLSSVRVGIAHGAARSSDRTP